MHVASDPGLERAFRSPTSLGAATPLARQARTSRPWRPPERPRFRRFVVRAALLATTIITAMQIANRYFAGPLNMSNAGGDPRWIVEVTSTESLPVPIAIYGRDVGFHIFRAPRSDAGREVGRAVPFELAHGNLHIFSIGWSALRVRTTDMTSPTRDTRTVTGRVVTALEPGLPAGAHPGW